MKFEYITYAVEDAVAVITLNRPEKANAQHYPLLHELNDAWNAAGLQCVHHLDPVPLGVDDAQLAAARGLLRHHARFDLWG